MFGFIACHWLDHLLNDGVDERQSLVFVGVREVDDPLTESCFRLGHSGIKK
jgi:hypothetical protein